MPIGFKKNTYFNVMKKEISQYSADEMVLYVKEHKQFRYGNVTFQKFKKKQRTTKGWFGRKVIALPAALWSGVVKSIYHLAKTALAYMTACSVHNNKYEAALYSTARDLQESFGWFATIFNDRYGQYHVQESQFHKTCYRYFTSEIPARDRQHGPTSMPKDIEKEFERIRALPYGASKEDCYEQLANQCLKWDLLPAALTAIESLYGRRATKEGLWLNVIEAYIKKGEQETAALLINRLFIGWSKKESLLMQIAESYFSEGNYEKALAIVNGSYSDGKIKVAFQVRVARAYIEKGDREKALKLIDTILGDFKTKHELRWEVAESYFSDERYEEAIDAASLLSSDAGKRAAFYGKVARAYISQGDREKALELINTMYFERATKEALLAEVAESYFALGNFEKALEIAKTIYKRATKEALQIKVAQAYLSKGDKENTVGALTGYFDDQTTKDELLMEVANGYYSERNLAGVLRALENYFGDREAKEALIVKVGNGYLARGERDKAFESTSFLFRITEEKFGLLTQIALSCFSAGDERGVLKALHNIAEDSLKSQLIENKQLDLFLEIMNQHISDRVAYRFFADLAKECFAETKDYFTQNSAEEILRRVRAKSTAPSTLQSFLKLKMNNSSSKKDSSRSEKFDSQKTAAKPSHPQAQYYSILGLTPSASKEDIRKAYLRLALIYHPDKASKRQNESKIDFENRQKEEYEAKFKLISNAYDILYGE